MLNTGSLNHHNQNQNQNTFTMNTNQNTLGGGRRFPGDERLAALEEDYEHFKIVMEEKVRSLEAQVEMANQVIRNTNLTMSVLLNQGHGSVHHESVSVRGDIGNIDCVQNEQPHVSPIENSKAQHSETPYKCKTNLNNIEDISRRMTIC